MASSSFAQAANYLHSGIECLPKDHWRTDYQLSLDLFSSAAKAEYCTGDIEAMEEHCYKSIEQKDRPVSDKFRVYSILVPSIGNRNRPAEACDLIVQHLKELGCTFPKFGQMLHVLGGIMNVKSALEKYTPEDFGAFKQMEDEAKIHTMKMLDHLATYSYFVNGSLLLPLSIFKNFRLTIEDGMSEWSPPTFALVGMIIIVQLRVSSSKNLTYCLARVFFSPPACSCLFQ